jgi:hypothetical protein
LAVRGQTQPPPECPHASRQIFLKYSPQAEFDPYDMRPRTLEALFTELVAHARLLTSLGSDAGGVNA